MIACVACAAPAQQTPVPTPPAASATLSATPAPAATVCLTCARPAETMTARVPATQTTQAMLTVTAAAEQACLAHDPICNLDGHFLMRRPIGPQGRQSIERSYPYGSTEGGAREPHHGVEFANAQGTPVLAVADGKVVFAGDDKKVTLAWVPAYYGNVIVLEHHFPGLPQTVYSLYAHLYKIDVRLGQQVGAGERIGQVGSTGTAIGSHLHFEVRLGANDYKSNRNPELWLAALPGTGVLAGHIEDAQGNFLAGRLNLQRILNGVLDPLSVAAPETYVSKELQPVRADDVWREGFTAGELAAGDYRLTLVYNGKIYEQMVKIEPDRLTLVRIVVGN